MKESAVFLYILLHLPFIQLAMIIPEQWGFPW